MGTRGDGAAGELVPTDRFGADDELPGGLRAIDARWVEEALLWSARH